MLLDMRNIAIFMLVSSISPGLDKLEGVKAEAALAPHSILI
jgi:hypothetical protein